MKKIRALIPTGLGFNCEYESAKAFELAGASSDIGTSQRFEVVPIMTTLYRMKNMTADPGPVGRNVMNIVGTPITRTRSKIPFFLPNASPNQPMKKTKNTRIPKSPCHNANSAESPAKNSVVMNGTAVDSMSDSQPSSWLTRPMTTTRKIIYLVDLTLTAGAA